jgi:polysaccharide lyase-like protein
MEGRERRRWLPLLLAAAGCAPRLQLGSEVLWSADHETGDLSQWSRGGKGGSSAEKPDTAIAVSTEFAHSGRYSVKLSNGAVSSYETARLWREDSYPETAYYSAWYYLPRAYQTTNDWTVMQIRAPVGSNPSTISLFTDIDIRSLPGGQLILSVFDHRAEYLRAATPDPVVPLPVGAWFHIEVLFRNAVDDTGRLTLWQDGQLLYDLQRPSGITSSIVYFTVCSISQDLSPTDSVLYVDDAAVSLTKVGDAGTL